MSGTLMDDLRDKKFTTVFGSPDQISASKILELDLTPMSLALYMRDDLNTADTIRLNRYFTHWRMYLGKHWIIEGKDGIKRVTKNYIKAFSNKLNRFLNINGFMVILPEKFDQLAKMLNKVWAINNHKKIATNLGLNGIVTGDMWLRINFKNDEGVKAISFTPLDSSMCFPRFDKSLKLIRVEIRHPSVNQDGTASAKEYIAEIHDREKGTVRFFKNSDDSVLENEIKDWAYDIPIEDELLVVHGSNYEVANSFWGMDDLTDLVTLNTEINEVSSSMREIIDYMEQPITVVKGAKLKNIDKSSRKIWSGIPKDGDVFNLTMNTDLPATQAYLKDCLQTMHDISGIPEQSLGKLQNISNTSGIALHYQNLPLMEVRTDKIKTYGQFYSDITRKVIKLLKWMDALPQANQVSDEMLAEEFLIPDLAKENPMQDLHINFPSPLPRDEILLLNEIRSLFELELESEEGAFRKLGRTPEEIDRIRSEIKKNRPVKSGGFSTKREPIRNVGGTQRDNQDVEPQNTPKPPQE